MIRMHHLCALLLGAAAIAAIAAPAQAGRASRIDAWTNLCNVDDALAGNGSVEVALATYDVVDFSQDISCTSNFDFANPRPLSLNIYGTLYETVFINENGNLTFGAPSAATGTGDLLNFAAPVIALALGDVDIAEGGSITYGWNPFGNNMVFNYQGVLPPGGAPGGNVVQLFITEESAVTGNEGDFTLEINYDQLLWDIGGLTAGFSNGAGEGFVFSGAGDPGAYLGRNFFDTPSVCDNPATGLTCNGFGADGETDFSGNLITGRYRFVFRNGLPVAVPDDDTTDVPAPPMLLLLGIGIGTVAGLRRRAADSARG